MRRTFFIFPLIFLLLLHACNSFTNELSSAYERYRAAFKNYIEALKSECDKPAIEKLKNEYITAFEEYQSILGQDEKLKQKYPETFPEPGGPDSPFQDENSTSPLRGTRAGSPVKNLLAVTEALKKCPADASEASRKFRLECIKALISIFEDDFEACKIYLEKIFPETPGEPTGTGEYSGEMSLKSKLLSLVEVEAFRKKISDFVRKYDTRVEEARTEYQKTSFWNPVKKLRNAFRLVAAKFARNKARFTCNSYTRPETGRPYVDYGREILLEIAYITPGFNSLFYDTELDTLTLPCSVGNGEANELILYVMPAPHGMDWRSPRMLAIVSGAFNQITFRNVKHKHLIGHAFIGLKARNGPLELYGMTTTSQTEEKDMVLKHGYGFGILFTDLLGRFDDPSELLKQIDERCKTTGDISAIRFLVSDATFARLKKYITEYSEFRCQEHYGGANRPRYKEGGGCSPFSISFLEIAGLIDPEYEKEWKISIDIPLEVCGGPAFGRRVSVTQALSISRWAKKDEPHITSIMWDPTLMFRWMQNRWRKEFSSPTGEYMLEKNQRALYLVMDCRHVPVPDEPIWLEGENPYRQHGYRYGPDPWAFDVHGNPVSK